jgi:DNA primase
MNLNPSEIKSALSMRALLKYYGIRLRQQGHSFVGCCPIHSGDNPHAFHVNLEQNLWHCFTREHGGDVFNFIMENEHVSFARALKIAQSLVQNPGLKSSRSPPLEGCVQRENKPLEFTLPLDPSHPYLRQRGLSDSTIQHFGLGYCSEGIMKGRIAIPIHDDQGKLVGYSGRSINGEPPKYQLPRGFYKRLVLFNFHRVRSLENPMVIVVEGFFDVFKLHQAGFPNVVALIGSSMSKEQANLFLNLGKPLVICLDGDQAGRTCMKKIIQKLRGKTSLIPKYLSDGVQPDQLDSTTLNKLLGRR